MKKLLLINILLLSLFACSKDDENPNVGPITLEFDNRQKDHPDYIITYDVTDIKLKRDDGYVFDNKTTSYHVDAADEGSQEISLEDLPEGNYIEVTFTVKNLHRQGDGADIHPDNTTYTLTMASGAPVRPEHEPEVHLIFNADKVLTDLKNAFVVDHVHAN